MSIGRCPVIPYLPQEDPRSNRMCGAACLAMVYRSLVAREEPPARKKRGRDRRSDSSPAPRGRERRAGRRRAEELAQGEIWKEISRPNRSGSVSSATHLMVAHARRRGFDALAIQARYPLVALQGCCEAGVRAIVNHRLRADGPAGHYSVLLDVDATGVAVHDPFYGPGRRIPHAELLDLWQPGPAPSEIAGHVLIGIAPRSRAAAICHVCGAAIPEKVPCPRCSAPVSLRPADLLGCVASPSCLGRFWNYLCCPACDNMWTFSTPAETAGEPAPGEGIWELDPFFARLDDFCGKALSVPGVAARADVKEQLRILEKSKVDLRLAEKEEMARAKEQEARVAGMKEKYAKEEAAVEKAREEAAKPPAPADGAALGDALLKELRITR